MTVPSLLIDHYNLAESQTRTSYFHNRDEGIHFNFRYFNKFLIHYCYETC